LADGQHGGRAFVFLKIKQLRELSFQPSTTGRPPVEKGGRRYDTTRFLAAHATGFFWEKRRFFRASRRYLCEKLTRPFDRVFMKTLPILLLLATAAQAQRAVHPYILDWSPQSSTLTLTRPDAPDASDQVWAVQDIDNQKLALALNAPPNARALLYIHCWLGETGFFHRRSMGWLSHALQTSTDTSPVLLLALRWPSGKRGYRHSANRAGEKGAACAPLLQALTEAFPDGRLDVFCHSMGNRFFQGGVAALSSPLSVWRGAGGEAALGRVVLFSPDVDADVFCTDFEKLAASSRSLHLYTHRRDRALWLSQKQLRRLRLGRSGPTALPEGTLLEINDMTHLRSLSNHTHFKKKVVQRDLGRVWGASSD